MSLVILFHLLCAQHVSFPTLQKVWLIRALFIIQMSRYSDSTNAFNSRRLGLESRPTRL